MCKGMTNFVSYFNSRPHGGRLRDHETTNHPDHFNSRPHGGRPEQAGKDEDMKHFNSRPHGGRQFLLIFRPESSYFNSRPHGGRQENEDLLKKEVEFQLTPSRRATMVRRLDAQKEYISTHALTEGDNYVRVYSYATGNFNSRPHGGRRTGKLGEEPGRISTHALTEGDAA